MHGLRVPRHASCRRRAPPPHHAPLVLLLLRIGPVVGHHHRHLRRLLALRRFLGRRQAGLALARLALAEERSPRRGQGAGQAEEVPVRHVRRQFSPEGALGS